MSGNNNNTIGENPVQFDRELRRLMEKLKVVKTYERFQRWKSSFLTKYEAYLFEDGIDYAERKYKLEFKQRMLSLVKKVTKVEEFVKRGEFTTTSVKAVSTMKELCTTIQETIQDMTALIPATDVDEKQCHYNKYHLGAVLIRDDFEEYERMKYASEVLEDILKLMGEDSSSSANSSSRGTTDKQQQEIFGKYTEALQKFCDVMADLGLYEVMIQCRQFAEEPSETESEEESEEEEEDEEDVPDPIIFVDLKTASIFERERMQVEEAGILTLKPGIPTEEDRDPTIPPDYMQTTKNGTEVNTIAQQLKDHPTLGVATQVVTVKTEIEEVDLAEAENVKNMWGVSLRKREKNKKGEEFIFIDPKHQTTGELSRNKCMENGFITPILQGDKEISIEGAIVNDNNLDYDRVIKVIRGVFRITSAK